ncbi:MAG: glucose-6-phosphate isomerase [Firmicutes bacterium]|nr:glucose-6-phosphate isomerase [Bacillota bacterium]
MKLSFDYNNMMESAIGDQGIRDAQVKADAGLLQKAFAQVKANRGKGWQEWTELPYLDKSEIAAMAKDGQVVRRAAKSFVVLGIGGSALGPLSVATALLHFRHNELPPKIRKAPKYYIEDNVDPERMRALLDVIDLRSTYFNVITKSGETSETLAQFLTLYSALKDALGKEEAVKRVLVTTTIGKGALYDIAKAEGFKIYGVGKGVGGRFSVFSPVGLVPLACLGIDIRALLKGARDMAAACIKTAGKSNPALITAYLQVKAMQAGKNVSVMMPYSDALKFMADFYGQLWGESLGKAVDVSGKTVYAGQTPAKSLGVTDQHSQIQLYTEGPFDKVVTFIAVEKFRASEVITDDASIAGCEFLKGRTFNELLDAEFRATRFALAKAKRMNFTVTLPEISAETVGELLMYFMYETAFAGALLNIDAYNQPGVEEGKKATFALMGRKGYEDKMQEVEAAPFDKRYVI